MAKNTPKKEIKKTATIKTETVNPPHVRPSWDEYFIKICRVVGERATCNRGSGGCVIVKDKRILVTGYVGAPAGVAHCDDVGHELHTVVQEDGTQSKHCIRTSHGEQNAIVNAARKGVAIEGATLYYFITPCYICAKLIINAGIVRVVVEKDYHASKRTKEVFKEAGVELQIINPEVETYANMK